MPTLANLSAPGFSAALEHLPPTAHLLAAGGVIVGLVLWAAGHKILRLMFAALGSLAGGGAGFFLLPMFAPQTIAGFPSPHVGLVAGGLIGVTLGILLFRFAVGILLAIGLGVAATLIGAAIVQFQPITDSEALRRDYEALSAPMQFQAPGFLPREFPQPSPVPAPDPEYPGEHDLVGPPPNSHGDPSALPHAEGDPMRTVLEAMQPVAERVRAFLRARGEEFSAAWGQLSSQQQATVVSASLAGIAAGFILGLVFPGRSSAAATAMAGAAVWLPCLAWLWRAMDAPGSAQLLTLPTWTWLAGWGAAAMMGFAIQSVGTLRPRRRG
jgi:hypothetical protein